MWNIFNWNSNNKKTSKKKSIRKTNKKISDGNQKSVDKKQIDKIIKKNEVKKKEVVKIRDTDRIREEFLRRKKMIEELNSNNKITIKSPNLVNKNPTKIFPTEKNDSHKIKKNSLNTIEKKTNSLENKTINFQPVFDLITEDIGDGFLGGIIVDINLNKIIFSHNVEADNVDQFIALQHNLSNTLGKSNFPQLNDYYLINLENNYFFIDFNY